jgi:type II secretory pathway pseudopilin PulG
VKTSIFNLIGGRASTIVLVLLSVLVVLFFVRVWPLWVAGGAAARAAKAGVLITNIAMATEQFRLHYGRYPTNLNELTSNAENLIFIYLPAKRATSTSDGTFLDSWNRRYLYVPPLVNSSTGYVGTLGKNGVRGGVGEDADQFVALPVPAN